jgi:hypothetical protein
MGRQLVAAFHSLRELWLADLSKFAIQLVNPPFDGFNDEVALSLLKVLCFPALIIAKRAGQLLAVSQQALSGQFN